ERGATPVLASPEHLAWKHGHAHFVPPLKAPAPAAIVRFFPADWLPAIGSRAHWEPYFRGGPPPPAQPGTCILIQSKRFPLVWDQLRTEMPAFRQLMPPSCEVRKVGWSERYDYVVKPALGRVGEDIAMAGITAARDWERSWSRANKNSRDW